MPEPQVRVRASALVTDSEGRLLLVLQPGVPADFWILPGGGVEEGETSREAVVREVREETGLAVEALQPIYVREGVQTSPATGRPKLHVEIIWRTRLLGPAAGTGEHRWRFFRREDVPPDVHLPLEVFSAADSA